MPQPLPLSPVGSNVFQSMAVDCVGHDIVSVHYVNYLDTHDKALRTSSILKCSSEVDVRGTEKFRVNTANCTSGFTCQIEVGYFTMVPVTKFFELIMPSLQGCPVSMVEQAVLSTCGEFCEKTGIWKQESLLTDIYEDIARYTFAPAPGAQVCAAESVRINGRKLQETDINTLTMLDQDWVTRTGPDPQKFFFDTNHSITLIPIPSEDKFSSMSVSVILKPTKSANIVPSVLYDDWAETIAAGTLKRLLAMRGKAWANETLVPLYERDFRTGISRAKSKSEKSWGRTTKNMYPETFYN